MALSSSGITELLQRCAAEAQRISLTSVVTSKNVGDSVKSAVKTVIICLRQLLARIHEYSIDIPKANPECICSEIIRLMTIAFVTIKQQPEFKVRMQMAFSEYIGMLKFALLILTQRFGDTRDFDTTINDFEQLFSLCGVIASKLFETEHVAKCQDELTVLRSVIRCTILGAHEQSIKSSALPNDCAEICRLVAIATINVQQLTQQQPGFLEDDDLNQIIELLSRSLNDLTKCIAST